MVVTVDALLYSLSCPGAPAPTAASPWRAPVQAADARDVREPAGTLETRALRGERAAWDELIRLHNHRVVVTLLARGAPMDRARDVAQDAWVRLMDQQRRGALAQLVLPGLAIAQAALLLRDCARREQVLRARHDDGASAAGEQHPDPAVSVEERLLSAQQLARAARALGACHPTAQEVFKLVYEDPDARYEDVARRVGLSLQRVRQIVCEVRKRLRAAIEEDDHV